MDATAGHPSKYSSRSIGLNFYKSDFKTLWCCKPKTSPIILAREIYLSLAQRVSAVLSDFWPTHEKEQNKIEEKSDRPGEHWFSVDY